MFCMKLAVYGHAGDPLALNAIYEEVAQRYHLPTLSLLQRSVEESVPLWPEGDYQVYYLDNLKEPQMNLLFQVHTKTNPANRDFTVISLSVENREPSYPLHIMSFQFPVRGDRGMSSFVIGQLKEFGKQQGVELGFLCEGFFERAYSKPLKDNYVKTDKLSIFQWVPPLARYLHVRERLEDIEEIRRGIIS